MRAIDADALNQSYEESFDLLNTAYEETVDPFEREICKALLMAFAECGCRVKEAPALTIDDLRPKGRWEDGTCTNCGQVDFSKPNFCPNCGADMRGGGEDE